MKLISKEDEKYLSKSEKKALRVVEKEWNCIINDFDKAKKELLRHLKSHFNYSDLILNNREQNRSYKKWLFKKVELTNRMQSREREANELLNKVNVILGRGEGL